jgi:hypothetical protein
VATLTSHNPAQTVPSLHPEYVLCAVPAKRLWPSRYDSPSSIQNFYKAMNANQMNEALLRYVHFAIAVGDADEISNLWWERRMQASVDGYILICPSVELVSQIIGGWSMLDQMATYYIKMGEVMP